MSTIANLPAIDIFTHGYPLTSCSPQSFSSSVQSTFASLMLSFFSVVAAASYCGATVQSGVSQTCQADDHLSARTSLTMATPRRKEFDEHQGLPTNGVSHRKASCLLALTSPSTVVAKVSWVRERTSDAASSALAVRSAENASAVAAKIDDWPRNFILAGREGECGGGGVRERKRQGS